MGLPDRSVWFDAQGAQSKAHGERGIARTVVELARSLVESAPRALHTIGLDPERPVPASLELLEGSGLLGWASGPGTTPEPPPSIYHIISPFEPLRLHRLWPDWARDPRVATVVTLHDLIPLLFPERYLGSQPLPVAAYQARLSLLRSADRVLSVSQWSASDAVEHLGIDEDRITVVDAGTSMQLASEFSSREEALGELRVQLPGLHDTFLLYVGGEDWRKNLEGMIDAYALLPPRVRREHQLVVACRLPDKRRAQLEAHRISAGIRADELLLTGFVSDRQLAGLYRACELFVFPSLYEGAGLPVLEAMSCGAPVAASNAASVPEVLGDDEATFDPADAPQTAAVMLRVLEDQSLLAKLRERSKRRAAQCTWGRVAEKTLEGYELALRGVALRPPRRRRKRLAVFTPWPAERWSRAAHSRHLVEALSHHAEVDVIVPGDASDPAYDRSLGNRVRLYGNDDFPWSHGMRGYDRLLYMLDSSGLTGHAYKALLERSGAVVALDVHLVGLYRSLCEEEHRWDQGWFAEKLSGMYEERVPAELLEKVPDPELEARFGIYMSREVQEHANALLVHSRSAAEVLRLEAPPSPGLATPRVVPFGIPQVDLPRAHAAGAGALIVCPADLDVSGQEVEFVLEAVRELREDRPGARIVFTGQVGEDQRRAAAAISSRVEHAVVFEQDPSTYWELLASADVGVLLHEGPAEAASQGVVDLIAARTPVVVTDAGWFGELPEPVVTKVPIDCSSARLAGAIGEVLSDAGMRGAIGAAQDAFAAENSYARVAEQYAEVLAL